MSRRKHGPHPVVQVEAAGGQAADLIEAPGTIESLDPGDGDLQQAGDVAQPSLPGVPLATGAREAFDGLCEELEGRADRALEALEEGLEEATQVLGLPEKYRKRLRTTSTLERLIQELRRREKVIRIFPHEKSVWRLLGAFLAERHEEWSTGRWYFRIDEYYARKERRDAEQGEVRPAAYPRISDQREAILHNFRDFDLDSHQVTA